MRPQSVTTKGCKPEFGDEQSVRQTPMRADSASEAKSAMGTLQCCFTNSHGSNVPTKPTTLPIDKSMPPVMITMAAPMLMMPKSEVQLMRFLML